MHTSACTPKSAPPVIRVQRNVFVRVRARGVPKREISHQPAFLQNFEFRLGKDKCHGPTCFHLSFEDGCEENCEGNPCSLARRVRDGPRVRVCCMHTVVIAFRV